MGEFNVVVTGSLLPGFDREQALQQLAALFKESTATVLRLLDGRAVTIKRHADTATADRFVQRLRQIGVDCRIENETLELDSDVFTTAPSPPQSASPFGAEQTSKSPPPVLGKPEPPPIPDSAVSPRVNEVVASDDLWKAVAQKRADYYLPKWKRYLAGEGSFPSWHWPAFFLGMWWALYRKAWAGAAILFGVYIGVMLFGGIVEGVGGNNASSGGGSANLALVLVYAMNWVLPALLANSLYFRKARSLVAEARAFSTDHSAQVAYLSGKGGTSSGVVVVLTILGGISVIGILAAIAIPQYQDYVARAKVAEALSAVEPVKVQIVEGYKATGQLPEPDYSDVKRNAGAKYIRDIEMNERGVLTVTLDIPPRMEGKQVLIAPTRNGERIEWTCKNVDAPTNLLPAACRN